MPEASAPGKLLLSGEYAVLRGAPAVSVSVGARALARVEQLTGPAALFDAASGTSWPFDWTPEAGLLWLAEDPGERGRLPAAVLDTLAGIPGLPAWPKHCRLQLDSDAFTAGQSKYGLGSSAALTVALTAVAAELLGLPTDRAALAPIAARAHRLFQRGSGSGVDVLTALHGGLVCVQPDQEPPQAEALRWPSGLSMVIAWSGRPASTPALIAAFDRFAASDSATGLLDALEGSAGEAAAAWRAADIGQILRCTGNYASSLAALDEAGNIGIVTDEHRRLADISAAAGAVYKSSGAGGGDLGFALTDSPSTASRLRQDFAAAGFDVLDMETVVSGLELSR